MFLTSPFIDQAIALIDHGERNGDISTRTVVVQVNFAAGKGLRPVGHLGNEKTRIDRRRLAWTKGRNGSRQSSPGQVL